MARNVSELEPLPSVYDRDTKPQEFVYLFMSFVALTEHRTVAVRRFKGANYSLQSTQPRTVAVIWSTSLGYEQGYLCTIGN